MTNLKFKSVVLLVLPLLAFTFINKAQENRDDAPIKVETVLLNIPVIVSDREGRNIPDLTKENFIITQNEKKQTIEFFAGEEAPMNVAIVLDMSGSTHFVLRDIKKAAREFIKVLRPEDKCMIVVFNTNMEITTKLTSNRNKLSLAISEARPLLGGGGSNMQDALYQIETKELARVKGRKAIIVLTDGLVQGRLISNQKLLDTLIDSETLVYPIFFYTGRLFPREVKTVTFEQLLAKPPINYLNSLAIATGGSFYAASGTNFKSAFQGIANELKKQYLIGFYPQTGEAGRLHEIKIEVDRKDVVIRTKRTFRIKPYNRKEN